MEEYGFIHYIKVDNKGNIIDGWSTGPNNQRDTADAIAINKNGDYQFRLIYEDGSYSEENVSLWNMEGIALFKYIDGKAVRKTDDEINAEIALIPPPPASPFDQMRADIDFISAMTGVDL